jgi:hypothetical protein
MRRAEAGRRPEESTEEVLGGGITHEDLGMDDTTAVSSTTGLPGPSSSTGVVGCGSFQLVTDPACQAVVEDQCCVELQLCDVGTPCNDLFACIEGCAAGDTACQQACGMQVPDGVTDAIALQDCFTANAQPDPACGGGQTAVCMSGLAVKNQECGDCLNTNCCMSWDACGADPACLNCLIGMGTPGCETEALAAAALACEETACANSCPQGICTSGLTTSDVECDTCLTTNCCTEFDTCADDPACLACITGMGPMGCNTMGLAKAAIDCQNGMCMAQCM